MSTYQIKIESFPNLIYKFRVQFNLKKCKFKIKEKKNKL